MALLVANGEPPLRLFVLVGECVEVLDGVALRDRKGELDVGFCVFVAGLWGVFTVSWSNWEKGGAGGKEGVHILGCRLGESLA